MLTIYHLDHGFHEHYFFRAPSTDQGLRIRFYPDSPHYDTEFLTLESCGQALKDSPLQQFPRHQPQSTDCRMFSSWLWLLQLSVANSTGFDWDEIKALPNIDLLLYGLWYCGFPSTVGDLASILDLVDPNSDEALDAALAEQQDD